MAEFDEDFLTLRAGDLRLDLAPEVGGSIARFRLGHQDLMRPASAGSRDAGEMACFPLVPFSNRIRGGHFRCDGQEIRLAPNLPGDPSPMHGQGWRNPWRVESKTDDRATLSFVHEPGEWPWRYETKQDFLLDDAGLTTTISCRNLSPTRMPCALGFHPYFPCDPQTRLNTEVQDVWTIDAQVLPVERVKAVGRLAPSGAPVCGRGLDHGYEGWNGDALIDWGRGARLRLTAAAPRFQLYAPPEGGLFVAEPVENANAALNKPQEEWAENGITLLAEGEERTLVMRCSVEN